jgi:hypothetical protein
MTQLFTGRTPAWGVALLVAGLVLLPAAMAGAITRGSALALPLVTGREKPELVLAQRAIDRSWGISEDSNYVEVDVPEWRSEGLAAALSAVVPGAGQTYLGEGSGVLFALVEVAGWTANRIFLHKAQTERDRSARFAGDPADTASAWSFARWSSATGLDPAQLERVWELDRQAFYQVIARDPTYLAGWQGEAEATRTAFFEIRSRARTEHDRATNASYVLWVNHLLAALDALRAARVQNLMLQHNLELKLRSSWQGRQPAVMAVLVRSF